MDTTPVYNLKVVVRETGLKPDTLRAWERRYGLPEPQRTEGGHRLYSQRDVEILKWLVARQNEGLSISNAVEMWRSLEAEGEDPLLSQQTSGGAQRYIAPVAGDAIHDLREAWVDACLAFDEQRAEQVLGQAFAVYPLETVCMDILQAGLASLGTGWYAGEVSVQQEHFASEQAMRRLEALMVATPPPTRPGKLLAACPPGEEHVFSLLMLTLFLRRQGWDVVYLGANVPVDQLEAALDAINPRLVVASAQLLHTTANLLDFAAVMEPRGVALAFGGRVFNALPGLRERVPGHFMGENLDEAAATASRLAAEQPPAQPIGPLPDGYARLLAELPDRLPAIGARIQHGMTDSGLTPAQVADANAQLGRGILAALRLGNIAFLSDDINWIHGVLESHQIPAESLRYYLNVYYEVVSATMGAVAAPLLNWLHQVIGTV